MNRLLYVPLLCAIAGFVVFCIVQSNKTNLADDNATTAETAFLPAEANTMGSTAGNESLLSIDEAKQLVLRQWQANHSRRYLYSRALPRNPKFNFQYTGTICADQPFLLASINDSNRSEIPPVPLAIDRCTGDIYEFQKTHWRKTVPIDQPGLIGERLTRIPGR